MENKNILTVSSLTEYIKTKLETDQVLKKVYLRGEISNLVKHSRGHFYFSIKDESAQIRAIMFSSSAQMLPFVPKDGDKVIVYGAINLYAPTGSYSINIWQMELDGIGNLYLAYEKLKQELQAKGLFLDKHKRLIPKYPQTIGVITSPTGAAIKDIINTIQRRYPLAKLLIYPALVQGDDAKYSIKAQIEKANQDALADVLIVGRGGGSIEDLWAFNEKIVIMSVFNSKIPVITGIGHETDFTLSDFVSDLRAPTPTGAAELATPDINILFSFVDSLKDQHIKNVLELIKDKETKLVYLDQRLENQKPTFKIKQAWQRFEKANYDLTRNYRLICDYKEFKYRSITGIFARFNLLDMINDKVDILRLKVENLNTLFLNNINFKQQNLRLLLETLKQQNPLKLMSQGYSVTLKSGQRITSADEVRIDDQIETVLQKGRITSKVIYKEEEK